MQPNTKIQRTGAEIFLLQLNLLPAADLERYAARILGYGLNWNSLIED